MPKKQIIGSILILIVLCFICKYIYDNYKVEPKTTLFIRETADCKDSIEEYYTNDTLTIYLDCIDNVIVDFTDRTLELDKAYKARQIDIDTIKKIIKKKHTIIKDKVYYYQDDNLSMLECIFDDKTNYIFGKDIEYTEGMCSKQPYLSTFSKEYFVLDVSKSKTKNLIYLTLKDEELDEVTTVSITGKYDLKEDTYYNFIFGKYHNVDSNDITTVFNENILLGATEVNNMPYQNNME